MTSHGLALWGASSTRSMRVQWMFQEQGLEHDNHPIGSRTGETLTEDYGRLNPKRKIPTFQHGDAVLTESAAIALYLSETFPVPDDFYVPSDPMGRARLNEWCYFVMMELDAHTLYVMRRHDGLKEIYGAAPVAVASAEEYFLKQLNAVSGAIDPVDGYLLPEGFSVADILMMTCLDWARMYGIPLPDAWRRYQEHVGARPAYLRAFEINYPGRAVAEMR